MANNDVYVEPETVTCSQAPAIFSHLATIPVASTPGWFHAIMWTSLPSPSAIYETECTIIAFNEVNMKM